MHHHLSPLRRRRATTALAGAVLLLTSLAACGGDDDTAGDDTTTTRSDVTTAADEGTTTTVDDAPEAEGGGPCDLMSDEVVMAVLGFDDIPRREPSEVPGQSRSCIKGSERTDDLTTASFVSVNFLDGGSVLVDQSAAEAGAVQVEGFGDAAVFLPSAGVLSIAVGSDGYTIQVVKNGRPSDQADATTVAEDVLGG